AGRSWAGPYRILTGCPLDADWASAGSIGAGGASRSCGVTSRTASVGDRTAEVYSVAMTERCDLALLHPPFGLVLRAGDLTLRTLRDADLPEYAELLRRPIFEDPQSPAMFHWYRAEPEERVRNALSFQWQ